MTDKDVTISSPSPSLADMIIAIRNEIRNYHFALDMRQNGNTACAAAMDKIQQVLNMPWVSGHELNNRRTQKDDTRGAGEERTKKVSR